MREFAGRVATVTGAVSAWADAVVAAHGRVNLVVNNAGVALVAPVATMALDDFDWLHAHPGGVRTEIARRARVDPAVPGGPDRVRRQFDRVARTPPDRAARRILRGVERNARRVLIGADAVAIDLLSRLPAGLYGWALAAMYRRNLKG